MSTTLLKGQYDKIVNLALKGYTARTIAEKLEIEIEKVQDVMPTAEERKEMRANREKISGMREMKENDRLCCETCGKDHFQVPIIEKPFRFCIKANEIRLPQINIDNRLQDNICLNCLAEEINNIINK